MKLRFTALTILGISYFGANSAIAAQEPVVVNFTGSVVASTCALSLQGDSAGQINLGQVRKNAEGDTVKFSFKGDSECDVSEATKAVFRVRADSMKETGIGSSSPGTGTASDSVLLLRGIAAENNNVVSLLNNTVNFSNLENITTKGLEFSAQLRAGAIAGSFSANVTFDVSYL
ncbi:hypothetical protein ABN224_16815 [Providencia rettgeri]